MKIKIRHIFLLLLSIVLPLKGYLQTIQQEIPLHRGFGQSSSIWYTKNCAWPADYTNTSGEIVVAAWTWNALGGCGEGEIISYIQFDLSNAIKNKKLLKAEIKLFYPTGSDQTHTTGTNDIYLYRVTKAWDEKIITWNTGVPTHNPTPDFSIGPATATTQNYVMDITALAKNWIDGVYPNYGIRMKLQNAVIYRRASFASNLHKDTNLHPRLLLTYENKQIIKSSKDTICEGEEVQLYAQQGSTGPFAWTSNPPGFSSSVQDPKIRPIQTTTYILKITINGNPYTDSLKIYVKPPVTVKVQSLANNICQGDEVQLTETGAGSGNYNWTSNPPGYSDITKNPKTKPIQNTVYILEKTANGCSKKDSILIMVKNPGILSVTSSDDTVCRDVEIQLKASISGGTADTYKWHSIPAGFSATGPVAKYIPEEGMRYVVSVEKNGCTRYDTVSVGVSSTFSLKVSATPDTVCSGADVGLFVTMVGKDSAVFLWQSVPAGFVSYTPDTVVTLIKTSKFILTTSKQGCKRYDTTMAVALMPPTTTVNDTVFCFDDGQQLFLMETAYKVTWLPKGKESAQITITQNGTYKVLLEDTNGCKSEKDFSVKNNCPPEVYVPSAFYPGSDVVGNTLFGPVFTNGGAYTMDIYNRWGQLVFGGLNAGWNGRMNNNGPQCPSGIYLYIIRVQYPTLEKLTLQGTCTKLD